MNITNTLNTGEIVLCSSLKCVREIFKIEYIIYILVFIMEFTLFIYLFVKTLLYMERSCHVDRIIIA